MKFVSMQLKNRADEIPLHFSDKNAMFFSTFFFSSLSVSSSAFAIDILLQSSSAFSTKLSSFWKNS